MYSYGSPHTAAQKQDDQLERTFSSYVRIQDVVLKTYLGRWTIGRSGERGSGISVLPARDDDDDDDDNYDANPILRLQWQSQRGRFHHRVSFRVSVKHYYYGKTFFGENKYLNVLSLYSLILSYLSYLQKTIRYIFNVFVLILVLSDSAFASWCVRGVMVIVVGNGHGDTSSNPGRDWLHFT